MSQAAAFRAYRLCPHMPCMMPERLASTGSRSSRSSGTKRCSLDTKSMLRRCNLQSSYLLFGKQREHWRQMRRALKLRERLQEAQCEKSWGQDTEAGKHISLKGVVRGIVWLNRKPYAILQDEGQRQAASRRRSWRRIGNSIIWLQRLQSHAGLNIPFRTEAIA